MKILRLSTFDTGVRVAGLGSALGGQVVTNQQLCALGHPTDPTRVERTTGIAQRRHLAPGESVLSMAQRACELALGEREASSLEQLVVSTSSPVSLIPTTGSALHALLEAGECPAHTLSATCSGLLFGLDVAVRGVLTGVERALVCATEARSTQLDVTDASTGALFGDAASAVLLEPCAPGEGILAIGIVSKASEAPTVRLGCAREDRLEMVDGSKVYFEAVEGMAQLAAQMLDQAGLSLEQVDLIVPHQANARIIKRLSWLMGRPLEDFYTNLQTIGNTSSASIGVAVHHAVAQGRVGPGDLMLWLAVGAGYTGGCALVRLDEALCDQVKAQGLNTEAHHV